MHGRRRAKRSRVTTPEPSELARVRSLRPWFLVAAMILTWLAGMHGVTTGCGTVMFLRAGSLPDDVAAIATATTAADPVEGLMQYVPVANVRAIGELGKVMLPVSLAKAILGMVLVLASAMVLAGRRGARGFVLQALGVNAVFAIVAYALTRSVRDHWIGAVVRLTTQLQLPPEVADFGQPSFWYWVARLQLVTLELGVLATATLAVLSRRSGEFLAAAEALDEARSAAEDDDE
jgi:hypothetical protein